MLVASGPLSFYIKPLNHPLNIFQKRGRGQGRVTTEFVCVLRANCSKTIKATEFKLDRYVPNDSRDVTH